MSDKKLNPVLLYCVVVNIRKDESDPWKKQVLYCGPDRSPARQAYYQSRAIDGVCVGIHEAEAFTELLLIHDSGEEDFTRETITRCDPSRAAALMSEE